MKAQIRSFIAIFGAMAVAFSLYQSSALAQPIDSTVIDETASTVVHAGEIFWDINLNGIHELNEPGVGSITVVAENMDGEIVGTTQSEADGMYLFTDLPMTDLQIRVMAPSTFKVTTNGIYRISTENAQGTVVPSTGLSMMVYLPIMSR